MITLPNTFGDMLVPTVIVGLVVSVILEKIPWFQTQTAQVKSNLVGVLTVLAGAGVYAINYFVSPDTLAQVDTWYKAMLPFLSMLINGVVSYTASQANHFYINKAGE